MDILLGSDHAGFDLKEACRIHLNGSPGCQVKDIGVFDRGPSDYPLVAHQMAREIAGAECSRGILICGTGLGVSMTANRHKGVRAALCHDLYTAKMARMHNDANILVMGGRVIGVGVALEMVDAFLNTAFEGERHQRRLDMIDQEAGFGG